MSIKLLAIDMDGTCLNSRNRISEETLTWLRRAKSQHLSIRADEIACIGDGENDIPMFKNAGIRFAMGNASPALKACADRIVASNDDDGVAEAIQFLLT